MAATKPRVRSEVTVCDMDGEAVVYEPIWDQLHYLNYSAALVLDLCDGTATMRGMAEAIADVFEMPVGDVEKRVRKTVKELHLRTLLEPTTKKGMEGLEARRRDLEEAEAALQDERGRVRMQVPRSA